MVDGIRARGRFRQSGPRLVDSLPSVVLLYQINSVVAAFQCCNQEMRSGQRQGQRQGQGQEEDAKHIGLLAARAGIGAAFLIESN